jgi:hypothetical protein
MKYVPVTVAVDAHGMITIRQNHFGANLHAYAALIFSLHILIRELLLLFPLFGSFPANYVFASCFILQFFVSQAFLQLL